MVNNLVDLLSKDSHEVTIGHENESNEDIIKRIKNGFIHVKFVNTKGGTELGVNIDFDKTNVDNFNSTGNGALHIEGITNLNYVKTKCIADVDLSTKTGKGKLEIL